MGVALVPRHVQDPDVDVLAAQSYFPLRIPKMYEYSLVPITHSVVEQDDVGRTHAENVMSPVMSNVEWSEAVKYWPPSNVANESTWPTGVALTFGIDVPGATTAQMVATSTADKNLVQRETVVE